LIGLLLSFRVLWVGVDGWPWAPYLAVKVATGRTFHRPPGHYVSSSSVGGGAYWDAVAWAVLAVDTSCTVRQGFEAVLEHVVVRFVARCSRICSHELVRHRLASYAQTSTRLGGFHAAGYAGAFLEACRALEAGDLDSAVAALCVLPPPGHSGERRLVVEACARYIRGACRALREQRGREVDEVLRYAQPDALAAHIMATLNLRQLLHMAEMRLHPHAHWEIRSLHRELLDKLWREHRVPAHLMLALKRPALAKTQQWLKEEAARQLEEITRHLPPDTAKKLQQHYTNATGAAVTVAGSEVAPQGIS
jgi:thymidylate synthase ThyX